MINFAQNWTNPLIKMNCDEVDKEGTGFVEEKCQNRKKKIVDKIFNFNFLIFFKHLAFFSIFTS
jgi:hypothetical protein